jgi:hypothetical protein
MRSSNKLDGDEDCRNQSHQLNLQHGDSEVLVSTDYARGNEFAQSVYRYEYESAHGNLVQVSHVVPIEIKF